MANYSIRKAITCLLLIAVTGCHNNKDLEYNNKMVKIVQQVLVTLKEEDALTASSKQEKWQALQYLKEVTDSSINAITGIKPENEAVNFHEKATAIFLFVKEEYIPLTVKWMQFREKRSGDNKEEHDIAEEELIEHYKGTQERLKELQYEAMVAQNNFVTRTNVEGNVLYLKEN